MADQGRPAQPHPMPAQPPPVEFPCRLPRPTQYCPQTHPLTGRVTPPGSAHDIPQDVGDCAGAATFVAAPPVSVYCYTTEIRYAQLLFTAILRRALLQERRYTLAVIRGLYRHILHL